MRSGHCCGAALPLAGCSCTPPAPQPCHRPPAAGKDLHSALALTVASQRAFAWHRSGQCVASDVAKALAFMHARGYVHADVKSRWVHVRAAAAAFSADLRCCRDASQQLPERHRRELLRVCPLPPCPRRSNVLLTQSGTAKLADLGLTRRASAAGAEPAVSTSDTLQLPGTFAVRGLASWEGSEPRLQARGLPRPGMPPCSSPCLAHRLAAHHRPLQWMAPEVLLGTEPTQAADVYSYGVLMWEVRSITGLAVGWRA